MLITEWCADIVGAGALVWHSPDILGWLRLSRGGVGSFVNSRKNQESNYQGQMLETILVQFWVSHDHHCASETRK